MRHKKFVRLHKLDANDKAGHEQTFPLFQRMVVPVLMLFCVLVVGL
jgi:hypothetical protein